MNQAHRKNKGVKPAYILAYAFLIIAGAAMFFPIVWMFLTALKSPREIMSIPPTILPGRWLFHNFVDAWTSGPFTRFFLNSLFVSSMTTLVVVSVSSLAGYVFAKHKFFGATTLFLLIISTMMIPEQVTLIPVYLTLRNIGLLDSPWGVILPLAATGFGTFLMRQYIITIPDSLLDAARIDGCSELGIFWRIILPLIRPALAVLTVFTFMASWDSFLWPLIVFDSERNFTLPLGLARFSGEFYSQPHYSMAVSFITALPVILVFLLAQRTFIKGIVLTGLKD